LAIPPLLGVLHSISAFAQAQPAGVAETPAASTREGLEEVVVSATKRDALVTDVPIPIQVFGSEQMEQLGIDDFAGFAQYTPGLSFTKRGAGQTHVVIRGLSTGNVANAEPQNRSLVGIYLDDVPTQLNGFNFDPDLFDVRRIEVLKGPQGTLFGDSAMAGAIRYVTTPPNLQQRSARLNVIGSNTSSGANSYNVRAVGNLPLMDEKLGLRMVGWHRKDGGWIDSVRTGQSDINEEKISGARIGALFQPQENFSARVMLLGQRTRSGGRPESEDVAGELAQDRVPEEFEDDALMANLTLAWNLPSAMLTSVTGYLDRDLLNVGRTYDRTIRRAFGLELPGAKIVDPWKQKYLTQEVRVSSSGDRRVDYTAGVFFARQVINYPTFASAEGLDQGLVDIGEVPSLAALYAMGCAPPDTADHTFCGSLDTTQTQGAVFGDVTVHLTDRFDLLAGARYFDWKQKFTEDYGGILNGGPTFKEQTIKESGINPRFGMSYRFGSNNLLFVNAAKGFRLGGVNDPLPDLCDQDLSDAGIGRADTFQQDSLWTYEAGIKLITPNRRVAFNGSVFQTNWSDVQTARHLDTCGYIITQNAGKVISRGLEFDTTMAMTDALRLVFLGSYTDAKLDEDSLNLGASKGDRVPFVPKWKTSAIIAYDFPVNTVWKGFASTGVSAQGNSFSTFSRVGSSSLEIPGATMYTFRVGAQSARYQLALFVDNATNERAVYNARRPSGITTLTYARPRTIGLELDVSFE